MLLEASGTILSGFPMERVLGTTKDNETIFSLPCSSISDHSIFADLRNWKLWSTLFPS